MDLQSVAKFLLPNGIGIAGWYDQRSLSRGWTGEIRQRTRPALMPSVFCSGIFFAPRTENAVEANGGSAGKLWEGRLTCNPYASGRLCERTHKLMVQALWHATTITHSLIGTLAMPQGKAGAGKATKAYPCAPYSQMDNRRNEC